MTGDPIAMAPEATQGPRAGRRRHVPERTCAGCGARAPRASMARIGFTADGSGIEWRATGGRGTYLHDAEECRRRFVSGKKRLPGLRAAIGRAARESLVDRASRNR